MCYALLCSLIIPVACCNRMSIFEFLNKKYFANRTQNKTKNRKFLFWVLFEVKCVVIQYDKYYCKNIYMVLNLKLYTLF